MPLLNIKKQAHTVDPALMKALIACEQKSKGHFSTLGCVLRRGKQQSFWKSIFQEGYKERHANAKKLFIADLALLGVALIALGTGVFFMLYEPTVTKFIELSIAIGETDQKNGAPAFATITIENTSDVALENAVLNIKSPNGFLIQKGEPSERWNQNKQSFTLDTVAPKTKKNVLLEALVLMSPDKTENLIAELTYNQKGREKNERKASIKTLTAHNSIFTLSTIAPQAVLEGSTLTITSTLKNTSGLTLNNVKIPPPFAHTTEASPALVENTWHIDEWQPDASFTFTAITTVDKTDDITPHLEPLITLPTGVVPMLTQTQNSVHVVSPELRFGMQETWQNPPELGTPLPFDLFVENNGQWRLLEWTFELAASENIRLSSGSQLDLQNKTIAWHKKEVLERSRKSTTAGTITIPKTDTVQNITLEPTLYYTLEYNGTPLSGMLKSASSSYALLAFPTVSDEARYFNMFGDQLGRGPLPPAVGSETKYWVHWNVRGGSKIFRNAVVKATLPSYVRATENGSVTEGKPAAYLSQEHAMEWRADVLNPGDDIDIFFELGVTPQPVHMGKSIVIINGSRLTVDNQDTQERQPLTSDLPTDQKAQMFDGAVVP